MITILKVFFAFFKIGLFAIGGAYSFLPVLEKELVDNYHWLGKDEFLDVLGIARVFPGAISIKYATYTGYKIAGAAGVIAANLGNILPPAILIFLAGKLYLQYRHLPHVKGAFGAAQMAVIAMILVVALRLVNFNHLWSIKGLLIAIISFILFFYTKIHPALVIIGAGVIGAFLK